MAIRAKEHMTGDKALSKIRDAFESADFACNEILRDYGEDFFVVSHEEATGIVEPFRVFVQSKGTTREANWTEYVDPLTVRNWVTGNELVVVVKRNVETGESRYCIPEDSFDYFDIHPYVIDRRNIPIRCEVEFKKDTPKELVWRARIRHYERMVRLSLPDNERFQEIPKARLFLMELFDRCGLLDSKKFVPSEAALGRLPLVPVDDSGLTPEDNFTVKQQVIFRKCVCIIADRLTELAPGIPLSKSFIEHGAIVLQLAGFHYGLDD